MAAMGSSGAQKREDPRWLRRRGSSSRALAVCAALCWYLSSRPAAAMRTLSPSVVNAMTAQLGRRPAGRPGDGPDASAEARGVAEPMKVALAAPPVDDAGAPGAAPRSGSVARRCRGATCGKAAGAAARAEEGRHRRRASGGEAPAEEDEEGARPFKISAAEAERFVEAVGGLQRLHSLLVAMMGDGHAPGRSEPPTAGPARVDEPAEPASTSGREDAGAEAKGAQAAGVETEAASAAPPDSPAASLAAVIAAVSGVDVRAMEPAKRRGKTEMLAAIRADSELHLQVMQHFEAFERFMGVHHDRSETFGAFSHEALVKPELRSIYLKWLDTPFAESWLIQELGYGQGSSGVIRQFMSSLTEKINEFPRNDGFAGLDLARRSAAWDMASMLVDWSVMMPMEFEYPNAWAEDRKRVALLQAHILVKAGKFITTCREDPGEEFRELRFRMKTVHGRNSLEARFLGTDEKYPVLQPWVVFSAQKEFMFFGRQGEEVFDKMADMLDPLRELSSKEPLPGARIFSVGLRFNKPVLVIYTVTKQNSLNEVCIGATSVQRLHDYVNFMEDSLYRISRRSEALDSVPPQPAESRVASGSSG